MNDQVQAPAPNPERARDLRIAIWRGEVRALGRAVARLNGAGLFEAAAMVGEIKTRSQAALRKAHEPDTAPGYLDGYIDGVNAQKAAVERALKYPNL